MRLARSLLACAVALAVPLLASADEKKDEKKDEAVVVTDKDNDGKVTVNKGGILLVKLQGQPSTGYTWVVAKNNTDVLAVEGKSTTEKIEGKPPIGGPVLIVHKFEAVGVGESKLELQYKRPFEKDKKPAKTFTVTVTVK
jgi:inhibitor of cysteine peptidase